MIKAGIIRSGISSFSTPILCVKQHVGWQNVHGFRQLNTYTRLTAILMPRKVNNFDDMDGSKWFSFIYFYVDITKLSSKDKEWNSIYRLFNTIWYV